MAKRNDDLRRWAIAGAEQRLLELAQEAAAIHQTFPELRARGGLNEIGRSGGGSGVGSGRRVNVRPGGDAADIKRPKRRLSAAGRKAISEAAKARWAREKSTKGGKKK